MLTRCSCAEAAEDAEPAEPAEAAEAAEADESLLSPEPAENLSYCAGASRL